MEDPILVTGASGFLGSNICLKLVEKGKNVLGLVRKKSDLRRLEPVLKNPLFKTIQLGELKNGSKFSGIIHTATNYGRLGESQKEVREVNINLPIKILSLCQAEFFVNCDTFLPSSLPEKDKYFLYATSKQKFLEQGKELAKVRGIKFINLKIYHMYGPDDNPGKFLPFVISKFLNGEKLLPLTPGEQRRDFIYISDVVNAFIRAAENVGSFGMFEHFEIGWGETFSLKEVLENLKQIAQSDTKLLWGELPYQDYELMSSKADLKNNSKLLWKAETGLLEGLKMTFDFYKKVFSK